jgi:Ca2+-binding EF-hand superfamily protein
LDPEEAFEKISEGGSEIKSTDVEKFLESLGFKASISELMALIRRMDTDGDSSISKQEFTEFLKPLLRDSPIRAYSSQFSPMRT